MVGATDREGEREKGGRSSLFLFHTYNSHVLAVGGIVCFSSYDGNLTHGHGAGEKYLFTTMMTISGGDKERQLSPFSLRRRLHTKSGGAHDTTAAAATNDQRRRLPPSHIMI